MHRRTTQANQKDAKGHDGANETLNDMRNKASNAIGVRMAT
jgi:hypothetical protein